MQARVLDVKHLRRGGDEDCGAADVVEAMEEAIRSLDAWKENRAALEQKRAYDAETPVEEREEKGEEEEEEGIEERAARWHKKWGSPLARASKGILPRSFQECCRSHQAASEEDRALVERARKQVRNESHLEEIQRSIQCLRAEQQLLAEADRAETEADCLQARLGRFAEDLDDVLSKFSKNDDD